MGTFGGEHTVEIAAPIEDCFAAVCDIEHTPDWHPAIAAAETLDADADGRASLVQTSIDAMVAKVKVKIRFTYEEPTRVHIERESGDLKHMTATWTFTDLGDNRTEAHYETEFDPGRILSALAKGPVVGKLENMLAKQPPQRLKGFVEN
jgi:ribosome-associated toxin RatA of RatAB toxin-antitoxin module